MRRIRFLSLLSVVLLLKFASPAMATCPGGMALPFGDFVSGYLRGCADSRPVAGFLFALSSGVAPDTTCPTATSCNNAGLDFLCEDQSVPNGQSAQCQPEAGVAGDGNVTMLFDWGGAGTFPGCPNPSMRPGVGRNYAIVIDNNFQNALISVGFSFELQDYPADFAHPDGPVFHCGDPRSTVIQLISTTVESGEVTAQVRAFVPHVFSDCDPEAYGHHFDGVIPTTCTEGVLPPVGLGNVYFKTGPCNAVPDIRTSTWNLGDAPDPNGAATLTFPGLAEGSCTFVGATIRIAGQETAAVAGLIALSGSGNCPDADHDGYLACQGDCDDANPAVHPGADEICDGLDNNCNGRVDDLGTTTCGVGACARTVQVCVAGVPRTCVPGQPSPEVCDGIDNDCNGAVDDADADHDGYTVCVDCNDANPLIHPGAPEKCNGFDDNCNGQTDEDADGIDSDGDLINN